MKQCIMLAAGLSSRMKAWKMMLPWGGTTVLDSAIKNSLSFCDEIILITGYRSEELHQRYHNVPGITLCHNPHYQSGMFSSVRCGARQLADGPFFIVPGDMPMLGGNIYAALWRQQSHSACLVPEYDGGCGHPLLLPADMRPVLIQASDNDILKRLVIERGRIRVPVTTAAIHWDLDTPEQYQHLNRYAIPDHTS